MTDDTTFRLDLEHAAQARHAAHEHHDGGAHHHHDEPLQVLTRRLAVAGALTIPVVLLAMLPPLQFTGWEWVALALTTPVVGYSGLGFHRAALQSARHLSATIQLLEDHVSHCVADALASGDRTIADEKSRELLAAVERFARVR